MGGKLIIPLNGLGECVIGFMSFFKFRLLRFHLEDEDSIVKRGLFASEFSFCAWIVDKSRLWSRNTGENLRLTCGRGDLTWFRADETSLSADFTSDPFIFDIFKFLFSNMEGCILSYERMGLARGLRTRL